VPAVLLVIGASMFASGCGSSRQGPAAGQLVAVREADFKISAIHPPTSGDVDFRVHNEGPDQHEFIIARSESGRLPLRSDGVTIDEEALEKSEVGALEPDRPGGTRDLSVHLPPGRYVLFCNMTGHYMGGMHTTLVVSQ
jgi:uncharacterized cupredoxin-like copper-binding protein